MVNVAKAKKHNFTTLTELVDTDLGPLPKDWRIAKLGDVFDFQNGVNAAAKDYGKGIRFANVLEVLTHSHLSASKIPGRVTLPNTLIRTFLVKKGDILFNRTSETQDELGLVSVYEDPEPIVFGGFVIRGRQRIAEFHPPYTGYAFRAPFVRSQITSAGQGVVRANIGQQSLGKILVPLPSLYEQKAIAEALADADALIESVKDIISKKQVIKQGVMRELLSGRKRLPGFARKWKSMRIGDFTDCTAGGTPSTSRPEYWGGDVPWMSSGELHKKQVYEVQGRITELGLQVCATKVLPLNCVLVGLAGQGKTRGTVAINRIPLCTNQSIAAILPSQVCSPDFLFHNLDARYDELRELSAGDGGRGGLNLRLIKNISIDIPNTDEQNAICTALTEMDAELRCLDASLVKAKHIKQGMMQELLTGRVRLV